MITLGTETTEGYIPHLRVMLDKTCIDAPVCVMVRDGGRSVLVKGSGDLYLPMPKRLNGALVYALPGGYTIAPGSA